MPNAVKSPKDEKVWQAAKDEKVWQAAKERAKKAGQEKNYAYITSVFERIKQRTGSKPRNITYEMSAKEKAELKREAQEKGYTYDKYGVPHKIKD